MQGTGSGREVSRGSGAMSSGGGGGGSTKKTSRMKAGNKLQQLVSKKKRRYVDKEHGFSLDLSYITENIIAMGFPSSGGEGLYRNPAEEVIRFFETKHKDKYRVYNLCSERDYDAAMFHGRVARYAFDDHNCPRFSLLYECCQDVENWLAQDPNNLAAIHCKAGKGRTGLVICCYLQFCGMWPDSESAQKFYAAARTKNQKGVTIPSQIRYVNYMERALRMKGGKREPPRPPTLFLESITIRSINSKKLPIEAKYSVWTHGQTMEPSLMFTSKGRIPRGMREVSFTLQPTLPVQGDIKVVFSGLFHFWLNTAFIEGDRLILSKPEIDKAHKDRRHKLWPEDFQVELKFDANLQSEVTQDTDVYVVD